MDERFHLAEEATSWLLANKRWVFCPIVHCHALAKTYKMPPEASFWFDYNFHMLKLADKLLVLTIPGWTTSIGVAAEMAFWRNTKPAGQIRGCLPGKLNLEWDVIE
jgi:hypothetical protein